MTGTGKLRKNKKSSSIGCLTFCGLIPTAPKLRKSWRNWTSVLIKIPLLSRPPPSPPNCFLLRGGRVFLLIRSDQLGVLGRHPTPGVTHLSVASWLGRCYGRSTFRTIKTINKPETHETVRKIQSVVFSIIVHLGDEPSKPDPRLNFWHWSSWRTMQDLCFCERMEDQDKVLNHNKDFRDSLYHPCVSDHPSRTLSTRVLIPMVCDTDPLSLISRRSTQRACYH